MPQQDSQSRKIRVLVMEDSALVRQVLDAVLAREPDLSVMVASNS